MALCGTGGLQHFSIYLPSVDSIKGQKEKTYQSKQRSRIDGKYREVQEGVRPHWVGCSGITF